MQIRCSFTSVILAGWYNRKTTLTQRHKNAQKIHTRPHNRTPLGRVVYKEYGSLYLVAHSCSTSGFYTAFLFQGLLGSTTYSNYQCLFVSPCQVTLQSKLEMSLHTEAMMHLSQTCIIIISFFIIYFHQSCPFQLMLEHVPKGEKLLLLVIYSFTSACQHPLYSRHSQ